MDSELYELILLKFLARMPSFYLFNKVIRISIMLWGNNSQIQLTYYSTLVS